MAHAMRQWKGDHVEDDEGLILNVDESNAHNEVDQHTCLTVMREVVPGLSRWLEYVIQLTYPH